MDSWSRPGKHSATPPPLYATHGDSIKYCQTCGRVMSGASKSAATKNEEKKYCSSRCRNQKPGPQDRRIENAFVALLSDFMFEGDKIPDNILAKRTKPVKGEPRVIVPCSAVEELIFGSRHDPRKTSGRKRNRASRAISGDEEDQAAGYTEDKGNGLIDFNTTGFAGKIRPPQTMTDINASIGGEKGWAERTEETEEAATRRREGLRITEEKERVKRAARRGVIFGFVTDKSVEESKGSLEHPSKESMRRKCEAVMNGSVVEPSFAKGDWGVRWRET